jgi:hypothetical protein
MHWIFLNRRRINPEKWNRLTTATRRARRKTLILAVPAVSPWFELHLLSITEAAFTIRAR